MKERVLAIIPARANSNRLPKKNIRLFGGKPLIQSTIESPIKAEFGRIIVTTDDDDILRMEADYPSVNFIRRPKELASDTATTNDVISHALSLVDQCQFDSLVLLQPTSPLRREQDIASALSLFEEGSYSSVVSVTEVDYPTAYTTRLPSDKSLDRFYEELKALPTRSQDFDKEYRLNGAIYITLISEFLRNNTLFCSPSAAYVMSKINSIDIDDEYDFLFAESAFQKLWASNKQ